MTQPEPLENLLTQARQGIVDFDFAEGLEVRAALHHDPGYLEVLAVTEQGGPRRAFAYRASRQDLEAHGLVWFLRRALRSLNDRYVAGHLPAAAGEAEHEWLSPPGGYVGG